MQHSRARLVKNSVNLPHHGCCRKINAHQYHPYGLRIGGAGRAGPDAAPHATKSTRRGGRYHPAPDAGFVRFRGGSGGPGGCGRSAPAQCRYGAGCRCCRYVHRRCRHFACSNHGSGHVDPNLLGHFCFWHLRVAFGSQAVSSHDPDNRHGHIRHCAAVADSWLTPDSMAGANRVFMAPKGAVEFVPEHLVDQSHRFSNWF